MYDQEDSEDLRFIREQSDRFESSGERGLAAIQKLMKSLTCSGPVGDQLFKELAMIDIDHRLQTAGTCHESLVSEYVDDYQASSDQSKVQLTAELICYEYSCRFDFGNKPCIRTYLCKYPSIVNLAPLIRQKAMSIDPWLLQIQSPHKEQAYLTHTGYDEIEIGRQQGNETTPFSEIYLLDCRRIVVVGAADRRVSRRHLRITREDDQQLTIQNITRSSEAVIGDQRVDPGETATASLGSELRIGDLVICFVKAS